jgi:hypothetical protein
MASTKVLKEPRRPPKDPPGNDILSYGISDTVDGVIVIAADGDMVLQMTHDFGTSTSSAMFRVSSSVLRAHSRYFEGLLVSGRFEEGLKVEIFHQSLKEQHQSWAGVPVGNLPIISIEDLGRISVVKAVSMLCKDFLDILHGKDGPANLPVANLANLVVLADRFDALDTLKAYVGRKRVFKSLDSKTTSKAEVALSEDRVRQRLYSAVMLEYPPWIEKYSARMILRGWVGLEINANSPQWQDLPLRLEDELVYRRDCVLETIQSLPLYFLGIYTSRERQCKLGYDSSPQCDSFQLGEMVRFFTRTGLLKLSGSVFDASESPEPFSGDISALMETLRQVPEYQIDRNHSHCGIRTRILPLLDLLAESLLHVGICPQCWSEDRNQTLWMNALRPEIWRRQVFGLRAQVQTHQNRHAGLRDMFTATERDWS